MSVFKPNSATVPASTASKRVGLPLVDSFNRVHRSLRISVTDACNIRCQYCMPADGAAFLPQHRLLSFDHIERFVRVVTQLEFARFVSRVVNPLCGQSLPICLQARGNSRG